MSRASSRQEGGDDLVDLVAVEGVGDLKGGPVILRNPENAPAPVLHPAPKKRDHSRDRSTHHRYRYGPQQTYVSLGPRLVEPTDLLGRDRIDLDQVPP